MKIKILSELIDQQLNEIGRQFCFSIIGYLAQKPDMTVLKREMEMLEKHNQYYDIDFYLSPILKYKDEFISIEAEYYRDLTNSVIVRARFDYLEVRKLSADGKRLLKQKETYWPQVVTEESLDQLYDAIVAEYPKYKQKKALEERYKQQEKLKGKITV